MATIEWADTYAVTRDVSCRADDDAIVSVIEQICKTGIDCPFGWPGVFVHFLAAHHSGHVSLPSAGSAPAGRKS